MDPERQRVLDAIAKFRGTAAPALPADQGLPYYLARDPFMADAPPETETVITPEVDALLQSFQPDESYVPPSATPDPINIYDPRNPAPMPEIVTDQDRRKITEDLWKRAFDHAMQTGATDLEAADFADAVVAAVDQQPTDPIPEHPSLAEQAAISYGVQRITEDGRPLSPAARDAADAAFAQRQEARARGYGADFEGPLPPRKFYERSPDDFAFQIGEMVSAMADAAGKTLKAWQDQEAADLKALEEEELFVRGRTLEDRAREAVSFSGSVQRAIPFAETIWPELYKDRLAIEAVYGTDAYGKKHRSELARALDEAGEPLAEQVGMPAENDLMYWLRVGTTTASAAIQETVGRLPAPQFGDPATGSRVPGAKRPDPIRALGLKAASAEEQGAALAETQRAGEAARVMLEGPLTVNEMVYGFAPGAYQRVRRDPAEEGWYADALQGFLERVQNGSSLEKDFALSAKLRLGPEWENHGWWAGLALDAMIDWEGFVLAPSKFASRTVREARAFQKAVPGTSLPSAVRATWDPTFDMGRFVGDQAVAEVERAGTVDAVPEEVRIYAEQIALEEDGRSLAEIATADGLGPKLGETETRAEGTADVSARADLDAQNAAQQMALSALGNEVTPGGAVRGTDEALAPRPDAVRSRARRPLRPGSGVAQADAKAAGTRVVDKRPVVPHWIRGNNSIEWFEQVTAAAKTAKEAAADRWRGWDTPRGIGFEGIRGAVGDPSVRQYTLRSGKGGIVAKDLTFEEAVYLQMKRNRESGGLTGGDTINVDGQRPVARWGENENGARRLVADFFFSSPGEQRVVQITRGGGFPEATLGGGKPKRARVRRKRGAVVGDDGTRAIPTGPVPELDEVLEEAVSRVAGLEAPPVQGAMKRSELRAALRDAARERALPEGGTRQQRKARRAAEVSGQIPEDAGLLRKLNPQLTPVEATRLALEASAEGGVREIARVALRDTVRAQLSPELHAAVDAVVEHVLDADKLRAMTDAYLAQKFAAWAERRGLREPSVPEAPPAVLSPEVGAELEQLVLQSVAKMQDDAAAQGVKLGNVSGTMRRAERRAALRERPPARLPGEDRAAYRRRIRAEGASRAEGDARVLADVLGIPLAEARRAALASDFDLRGVVSAVVRQWRQSGAPLDALPAGLRTVAEQVARERGLPLSQLDTIPEEAVKLAAGDFMWSALTGAPPAKRAPSGRTQAILRDAGRLVAQNITTSERLKLLPTLSLVSPREYEWVMRKVRDFLGPTLDDYAQARTVARRIDEAQKEGREYLLPDAELLRDLAAEAKVGAIYPLTPGAYNAVRKAAIRRVAGVTANARYTVRGQARFVDQMLSAVRSTGMQRRRPGWGRRLLASLGPTGEAIQEALELAAKGFTRNPAEGLAPAQRAEWELLKRELALSPEEVIADFRERLTQRRRATGKREADDAHIVLVELAGSYVGPRPSTVTTGVAYRAMVGTRSVAEPELLEAAMKIRAQLRGTWGAEIPLGLDAEDPLLWAQAFHRWAGQAEEEAAVAARMWIESAFAAQGRKIRGTLDTGKLAEVVDLELGARIYDEVYGQGNLFGPATEEALGRLARIDRTEADPRGFLRFDFRPEMGDRALVAHVLQLHRQRLIRQVMDRGIAAGLWVPVPLGGSARGNLLADMLSDQHRVWDSTAQAWRYRYPEAEIAWAAGQLERWGMDAGANAALPVRRIGGREVTLPAEMAEQLDSMTRAGVFSGREPHQFPGYSTLLSLWKESRLHGLGVPRPSYLVSQIIGTGPLLWASRGFRGSMAAGAQLLKHPALVGWMMARARGRTFMQSWVLPFITDAAGMVTTPEDFFRGAQKGGLFETQSSFETGRELARIVTGASPAGSVLGEVWRHMKNGASWWQDMLREVGGAFEQAVKLGVYIDNVKQGMPVERAALDAANALPNYRNLTDFEREWVRTVFPFYAFMRKSADQYTYALLTHPHRVMAQARLTRDSARGDEPLISRLLKAVTGAPVGTRTPAQLGAIRNEDLARLVIWQTDGVFTPDGRVSPLYSHMSLGTAGAVGIADYLLTMRMLMQPMSLIEEGSDNQRRFLQMVTPVGQAIAIGFVNQTLTGRYDRTSQMRVPNELRAVPWLRDATHDLFGVGVEPWRGDPRLADADASLLLRRPAVWTVGSNPEWSDTARGAARKAWAETLLIAGGVFNNVDALEVALGTAPPAPDNSFGDATLAWPLGMRWSPSYAELELVRRAYEQDAQRAQQHAADTLPTPE